MTTTTIERPARVGRLGRAELVGHIIQAARAGRLGRLYAREGEKAIQDALRQDSPARYGRGNLKTAIRAIRRAAAEDHPLTIWWDELTTGGLRAILDLADPA